VAEYPANGAVGTPQKEYGYRDGQLLITAEPAAAQNVSWTNAVGVSVNGNSLMKTAATGWGNAGASSTQSVAAGDAYVEATATETTTARLFGFSHTDTDQSWPSIQFGIDLDLSGSAYVFESGNNRGNFGAYAPGDKFQVAIVGGVVKYKKNGTVFYTSSVTPTYPLVVDTALHANGCTLSNVVLNAARLNWLVPDHLGTPRIILDQTGTLANLKRHDYLPFGEELGAGTGGRTTAMGYVSGDGVRQQFTSKERDVETGLDYFYARYYSSKQGRFISPDEFTGGPEELFEDVDPHDPLFYADTGEPQSLNKYHYALNNPLRFVDPDGHQTTLGDSVKAGARAAANTILNTVEGVASAFTEDNGWGGTTGPQNKAGRAIGHGLALVQGAAEVYGGFQGMAGGGAEAIVTSPACASGAGCVAPATGLTVAVGSLAVTAHGTAVLANTLHNIFNKNSNAGNYAPNRELPRDVNGKPVPESQNPHTQLGTRNSRSRPGQRYTQGREFGKGGKHVKDIDFTNHGRGDHTNPHQHKIDAATGKRLKAEPLK